MKILAAVLIATMSFNSFALRCGTQLVTEGDSVQEVVEACGQPDGDYSNIEFTAPDKLYYKDGGNMTCELTIVNGRVTNEDCNR